MKGDFHADATLKVNLQGNPVHTADLGGVMKNFYCPNEVVKLPKRRV